MQEGKEVKINDSTSNTAVFFFHFVVTDTFLSLPKIPAGVSFSKHSSPSSYYLSKANPVKQGLTITQFSQVKFFPMDES